MLKLFISGDLEVRELLLKAFLLKNNWPPEFISPASLDYPWIFHIEIPYEFSRSISGL